jgi:bidirectional [NiFe] hydrogenase diaphorase subunit
MTSNSSGTGSAPSVPGVVMDGQPVHARAGNSILDVARANGISIPTLCHLEGLSDVGACRLCMVETQGSNKLIPACVTPITPGMQIITQSSTLAAYRKMVLELLFSERNHICSVCVVNGHCELQSVAQTCGVDHVTYAYACPSLPVDYSHPRFALDHNRCILCSRCIRVCAEVEGANTWGLQERGSLTMLIADLAQPWGESLTCTSCGKCVQVCPTGALFEKGKSVAEMAKRPTLISELVHKRQGSQS